MTPAARWYGGLLLALSLLTSPLAAGGGGGAGPGPGRPRRLFTRARGGQCDATPTCRAPRRFPSPSAQSCPRRAFCSWQRPGTCFPGGPRVPCPGVRIGWLRPTGPSWAGTYSLYFFYCSKFNSIYRKNIQ